MKNKTRKRRSFKQLSKRQKAYAQQEQQPPPNFPPPGTKNPSKHKPTYSPYPRSAAHANAYPKQYVKPKANQKHSKHTQPDQPLERFVKEFLTAVYWVAWGVTMIILASIIIGGTIGLNMIDLVSGAMSIGSLVTHFADLGWIKIGKTLISAGFSVSFSLIQLAGWLAIGSKRISSKWRVVLYGLMAIDTIIDTSVLNLLFFGESVLEYSLIGHGPIYVMINIAWATLNAIGERMTVFILQLVKEYIDAWSFIK